MNIVSKEAVLSKTSEYAIYQYYFYSPIKLNKHKYTNPFRNDRKVGSCIFKLKNNSRLYFIDYATNEHIDCFGYVMRLYNINFYQALCKINTDLDLKLPFPKYNSKELDKPLTNIIGKNISLNYDQFLNYDEPDVNYRIHRKDWDEEGLGYWNAYGITKSTLEKFEVCYVKKYYASYGKKSWLKKYDDTIDTDPCFAYQFTYLQKLKVKIYRPLFSSDNPEQNEKWKSNTVPEITQGYKQLPPKGDILIITSSLKDVMTLYEAGIPSVAPQAESIFICEDIFRLLKKRFTNIYICYDNDSTGIRNSIKFSEQYRIPNIILPKIKNCKDPSDLSKNFGVEMTRNIILQKINIL